MLSFIVSDFSIWKWAATDVMTLRGGVEGTMVRGWTQSRCRAHSGYLFPTSGSGGGKLENVTVGWGGGNRQAVIAFVFTVAIKREAELMRSSLTFLKRGLWGSH